MKTLKFIRQLFKLLRNDTPESRRFVEKVQSDPERSADKVYHLLGSSTQPIKLTKNEHQNPNQ